MINQIYKLAKLFEKKAIARFPPLMAEEISSWAKKIYLSELNRDGTKQYTRKFDIDLDHLGIDIESWPYDGIEVQLNIINKPEVGGQFDVEEFKIYITLSRNFTKSATLIELDNLVEHELTHMVQHLLMLVKQKKEYPEITSVDAFYSWYGKTPHNDGLSEFENHAYLENVEFQPYLLNAVRTFIGWTEYAKTGEIGESDSINHEITRKDFDIFVGHPQPVIGQIDKDKMVTFPFFQKLHDYDYPRWKKAVKEFWKLVEIYVDK